MTSANISDDINCDDFMNSCKTGLYYCSPSNATSKDCLTCSDYQTCILTNWCQTNFVTCVKGVCLCENTESVSCNYIGSSTPIFITASQIVLSTALVMGMAALTMVVYRLCTKPRYLSARQRALASQMGFNMENENISYANYIRASLTSMQIRVLTRMRDRPPTYDNRPASTRALPEAPPPYEGNSEVITLPPPYMEVAISHTGYTNATFNDPDPDGGRINRTSVCPNCDASQETDEINCGKEKSEESSNQKTETRNENTIPL